MAKKLRIFLAALLLLSLCACGVGSAPFFTGVRPDGSSAGKDSESTQSTPGSKDDKGGKDDTGSKDDKGGKGNGGQAIQSAVVLQDQERKEWRAAALPRNDLSALRMTPVELVNRNGEPEEDAKLYKIDSTGKVAEESGCTLYYVKNTTDGYISLNCAPVLKSEGLTARGETSCMFYLRPQEGILMYLQLKNDAGEYFFRGWSGTWEKSLKALDITDQLAGAEIYRSLDGAAVLIQVTKKPGVDFRVDTRIVMNLMKDGVVVDRYYTADVDLKKDVDRMVWRFDLVGGVEFDSCYLEFEAVESVYG